MTHFALAAAITALVLVLVMGSASPAFAQDPTGTLPKGDEVPTWIFLWTLGLGSAIITALLAALKTLWKRMNSQEQTLREHYEGTLENPQKGVLPQLRTLHETEKKDLRVGRDEWRGKFEDVEEGRREDIERMRQEERTSMRDALGAMKDVAAALQVNSVKMDALIKSAGYDDEEEDT